jgi:hypothetical protein
VSGRTDDRLAEALPKGVTSASLKVTELWTVLRMLEGRWKALLRLLSGGVLTVKLSSTT